MLTANVKSSDLASVHEIHLAALRGGMFYSKPYRVNDQIVGAEGTVLMVSGGSLVACTMATRNRMIIHTSIPCTNVDNNDGDLFAIEAPKEFDRVLRRFGDKQLALTFGESRLSIVIPRSKNARGMLSVPLQRVNGHMLSVFSREAAVTLSLDVDILIAALRRIPRDTSRDLITVQPRDAGLDLQLQTRVSAAKCESTCRCGLVSTNDSFPSQEKKE